MTFLPVAAKKLEIIKLLLAEDFSRDGVLLKKKKKREEVHFFIKTLLQQHQYWPKHVIETICVVVLSFF